MRSCDERLAAIAAAQRVAIMAHLVAGYRSPAESLDIALGLARNGADLLEIQMPFSDPTADGPVITAACQTALEAGTRPRHALELAGRVIAETGVPVFLMSYFNLLFRWPGGLEAFTADAAARGVAGLIVPDIPPEEHEERYFEHCRNAGLHPVVLVSPNTDDARLAALAPCASGMVYATARVGTTGAATNLLDAGLTAFLGRLKRAFKVPIAVGFGIRSRDQVQSLAGLAHIAVVGTRFLTVLAEGGVPAVIQEIRALAGALPAHGG